MEGLFGQTKGNLPDLKDVYGPAQLIRRVQKMKGTVINRMKFKAATEDKTDKEIAEEKRMKKVERIHKNIKCLSSNMNACQAIVKPDCSKPKVMKASGIQQALTSLLLHLLSTNESIDWNKLSLETPKEIHFEQLSNASLMWLKNRDVPLEVKSSVRFITVEFAGAKFKCKVPSGSGYLNYVESSIIKPLLSTFPLSNRIIICEEKYSFTPGDFKAATREQRKKTSVSSIAHLKTGDDIISSSTFVKEAIVSTQEGKIQISTFLAKNAQKLNIKNNITIVFDSEFHLSGCICKDAQSKCSCNTFAVPLRCFYLEETGYSHSVLLHHIKQRKGEAEMSQVDWLIENILNLKDGEAVLSVVTSGDIDAIVIHMFALSYLWPRNEAGKFQHPVYVMLQKPGKIFDLYNITNILELLETKFEEVNVGIKIALILCLGGNDFLPKFYSISHKKILETILKTTCLKDKLITIIQNETFEINIDKELYKELIKTLYCPKKTKAADFSFEEVRKMTVLRTKGNKNDATKSTTRNAQLWMPPLSAIVQLHRLIQCQIKYLLTVGHPEAQMPNFLQEGCLKKTENGEIEYDLGPDAFIGDVDTMFNLPPEKPFRTTKGKRKQKETPQKGSRRKLPMTSTPRKQ